MRTNRRRRNLNLPEITLTPLIDTALTLLIIFMVTTPMLQDSIKVELPTLKNQSQKAAAQQNLVVFIDNKENIFLNGKQIRLNNLVTDLAEALEKSEQKLVMVKGDRSIKYDAMVKVLDIINSIKGKKHVALAAKKAI